MAREWTGRDSTWSRHSRPEAQKALELARAEGFLFRTSNGHPFGFLKCRAPDGPCTLLIHSTSGSNSGTETARVILQFIRSCEHHREADDTNEAAIAQARLAVSLSDCSILMDAIEELNASDDHRRDFDDYLFRYEQYDDQEDFELAAESDELAVRAANTALVTAATVRSVVDWPPEDGAKSLLDDVEVTLTRVELALSESKSEDAELAAGAAGVRRRYDRLIHRADQ